MVVGLRDIKCRVIDHRVVELSAVKPRVAKRGRVNFRIYILNWIKLM